MTFFSRIRASIVGIAIIPLAAQPTSTLIEKIKNASYRCGTRVIQLKDGSCIYPIPTGGTGFAQLDTNNIALANSGTPTTIDAAIILLWNEGGTAPTREIHAIQLIKGVPQDVAAIAVQGGGIKSLALENGTVKATVLSYGPGDAHCCPSVASTKIFRIRGAALVPVFTEEEVLAHLQKYESAVTNLAAVEITMAQDPQAIYAMTQLTEQARRGRTTVREATKQIREAGLLHDDRFLIAVSHRIEEKKRICDAAALTFSHLSPNQQRAVLVLAQVEVALSRLIGK